jgi:hypothetical protein
MKQSDWDGLKFYPDRYDKERREGSPTTSLSIYGESIHPHAVNIPEEEFHYWLGTQARQARREQPIAPRIDQSFDEPLPLPPAPLRPASVAAIRQAMRRVYSERKHDPPNVNKVVAPVQEVLAQKGLRASKPSIQKVAAEQEFQGQRNTTGRKRVKGDFGSGNAT